MSESMPSPWIRDYLIDVAETHGVQLYNAPVSNAKKRVQLINLLTYHAESYVWAWISDKDYKVSVRFSKDAADVYKNNHHRNIFDCRFSLIFISSYRPIFCPRPLGPNAPGHTPVSHISLEVDRVSLIGIGAHLFGDPRDLESDQNLKEWVIGLREDGGGGNVLKLRKQQRLAQNIKAQPAPAPAPLVNKLSVSHHQTMKHTEDAAEPKPERPQDFKRAHAKRWRVIAVNPWKFATKPAVENRTDQTSPSRPSNEPLLDTAGQPQLRQHEPAEHPTSPCRTPPRASSQRQGTPTNWSPSIRGSPSPHSLYEVSMSASPERCQQDCDEPVVSPTASLPPDANEPVAADTTSDSHSLQPPTPAQRIKRSPLPCSSPPRSSPEPIVRFSQYLSSPLSPSSSLPPPPSSLPLPTGIRKNFQRKIPHPGPPVPQPDTTKQGPVQILVPNSDTSGTGSSQSISQSQPFSQSQRQSQWPSHPPALPSSLAKEFKPRDTSLHTEDKPVGTSGHTPEMTLTSLPINDDGEEEKATADNRRTTEAAIASAEKHSLEPDRPSVPSPLGTGMTEVGKSETRVQDPSEGNTDVDHHENQSAVSLTHGPTHDVEAWKEPTFIAKNKGKGKHTVKEPDTPIAKVDKKRRRSVHPETPLPKRARVESPTACKATSGRADKGRQDIDIRVSAVGKPRPNGRSSSSAAGTAELVAPLAPQSSKPRLAGFSVNFERISLGEGVPIPTMTPHPDIKRILLTTGRIRKNRKVEEDGSVFIYQ